MQHKSSLSRLWLIAVGCIWLAGCMVGPDYQRPQTAANGENNYHWLPKEWQDVNDADFADAWWTNFNDPVTDELVQKALMHNNDLIAAAASVDQYQAFLTQAYGVRWPQVSYGFNRTRNKMSFSLPQPTGRVSFISQSYTQDLSISYVTDIFGKLKRSTRAAQFDLFASENDRQALAHAIIAQVIQTRIDIATQQRLLQIADQTVNNWKTSLNVIDRRYQQGLVSPVDVYLAKENLANAEAQQTAVEQSLVLTLHALDVLCGQAPASTENLEQTLASLPELSPVPAGLPAALLDRRPDVRAAEMRLAAATERIGVNIAAMYPDLTLTATGGYASDTFRMVTATENQVYAMLMDVTAPIFQGGRLKAGVKAAKAAMRQAAAQYAGTVLTAMREVEDALAKQQLLNEQITQLTDRLQQARAAERLASDRYSRGVDTILLVLETERRRRLAENELAIAQGSLWQARVELFLALGGDWGLTDDASASTSTDQVNDSIRNEIPGDDL